MNYTPASSIETDLQRRPITKRALVQRINRALAKDGHRLMASRGMKEFSAFGDYYVVDGSRLIAIWHLDLETLGREMKTLKEWECLEVRA